MTLLRDEVRLPELRLSSDWEFWAHAAMRDALRRIAEGEPDAPALAREALEAVEAAEQQAEAKEGGS